MEKRVIKIEFVNKLLLGMWISFNKLLLGMWIRSGTSIELLIYYIRYLGSLG